MKHSDFHIGLIFHSVTGTFKCTDVGTRTICAIRLSDPLGDQPTLAPEGWGVSSPPYGPVEEVFNERAIGGAYRDDIEAVREAIQDHDRFPHRYYPSEWVSASMELRHQEDRKDKRKERHRPTHLRREALVGVRVNDQGHELTAHGAHQDAEGAWHVRTFDFHAQKGGSLTEAEWFILPFAADQPYEPKVTSSL